MSLTQTVTWIAVEERLPESNPFCLYNVAFVNGATGTLCRIDGRWRDVGRYDEPYPDENITHWALPLTHPAQLQAEGEIATASMAEALKAVSEVITQVQQNPLISRTVRHPYGRITVETERAHEGETER